MYQGSSNAHRGGAGGGYEIPASVLLLSRRSFLKPASSKNEIAEFRVPPHMVGDLEAELFQY